MGLSGFLGYNRFNLNFLSFISHYSHERREEACSGRKLFVDINLMLEAIQYPLLTTLQKAKMLKESAAASPKRLFDIGYAFSASRVLLTAIELDLFSILQEPKTSEEIRSALNLHKRGFPDFPDCLVALGVLNRDGNGESRKYSNTSETSTFLVPSSPQYVGAFLRFCAVREYHIWGNLTETLRTGELNDFGEKRSFFDLMYSTPSKLEAFVSSMTSLNTPAHQVFAKQFDFSDCNTLLDVGGASGQLCVEVAKINKHVQCYSMDLPPVTEVAKKLVEAQDMGDRVHLIDGDMDAADVQFPKVDVVVMGMILHSNGYEERMNLLRKAYIALNEGGRFVAIETLIDDDRSQSVAGLLMSLTMMLETKGGRNYTPEDFDCWAKEVGFKTTERCNLLDPVHCVIAYK